MLEQLETKTWLELNAKLQQKKNALRKDLKEKGILKRGAKNDFDNYKYFSEAQYKELFTELLSKHNLELKFDELEYSTFEGPQKQANGRMPKLEFALIDCQTGFYEVTHITGEGIDKGDKAGYKAYTGALKYYLANTFMVATGDDPEKESPETTMNKRTLDEALLKEAEELKIDLSKVAIYLKKSVTSLTNEDLKKCIEQKKKATKSHISSQKQEDEREEKAYYEVGEGDRP